MKTLSLKVFLVAVVVGALGAWAFVPPVMRMVESAAIKEWSSGERVSSADLNGNFRHIHNLMVGGHGGRLVDADVSAGANIAASKIAIIPSSRLAAYRGIPVAWGQYQCDGGACGALTGYNVTSVARSGSLSQVTLNYTPTDGKMGVMCSGMGSTPIDVICKVNAMSTAAPQLTLRLTDGAGAGLEGIIMFSVFDDN